MSEETKVILTRKEVIAIDQDSLGVQGFRYSVKDSVETWLKPLKNGDWAVCFLNRNAGAKEVSFNWQQEVITDSLSKTVLNAKVTNYTITDLWNGGKATSTKKTFKRLIPAHDVVLFRLTNPKK